MAQSLPALYAFGTEDVTTRQLHRWPVHRPESLGADRTALDVHLLNKFHKGTQPQITPTVPQGFPCLWIPLSTSSMPRGGTASASTASRPQRWFPYWPHALACLAAIIFAAAPTILLGYLVCVTLPLYVLGRVFFSLIVLHTPSSLPRQLFALTFSATGALMGLVLLEIYGELPARARWLLWKLHLSLDLTLLVLVLPYAVLVLTLRRLLHLRPAPARWAATVPLAAWLWFFIKVGEPFPVFAPGRLAASRLEQLQALPSLCLSRAGVIGVCVSALLSGVGAVHGLSLSLTRRFALNGVVPAQHDEAQRRLILALQRLVKHELRVHGIQRRLAAAHERARQHGETAASALRERDFWRAGSALVERFVLSRTSSDGALTMRGELREACGEGLSLCVALRRELTGFAQLLEDERTVAMGSTVRGSALAAHPPIPTPALPHPQAQPRPRCAAGYSTPSATSSRSTACVRSAWRRARSCTRPRCAWTRMVDRNMQLLSTRSAHGPCAISVPSHRYAAGRSWTRRRAASRLLSLSRCSTLPKPPSGARASHSSSSESSSSPPCEASSFRSPSHPQCQPQPQADRSPSRRMCAIAEQAWRVAMRLEALQQQHIQRQRERRVHRLPRAAPAPPHAPVASSTTATSASRATASRAAASHAAAAPAASTPASVSDSGGAASSSAASSRESAASAATDSNEAASVLVEADAHCAEAEANPSSEAPSGPVSEPNPTPVSSPSGSPATAEPTSGAELSELVGCGAAALMGYYLLSSVLMMRGSLPLQYRQTPNS